MLFIVSDQYEGSHQEADTVVQGPLMDQNHQLYGKGLVEMQNHK
jgi:hypothetical protein